MTSKLRLPSHEDHLACQAILFEWADSFDAKDWDRLRQSLAPTLMLDYREITGKLFPEMPAEQFLTVVSDPVKFLGCQSLRTQHFIGNSRWHQESDTKIISTQQMRVAHQRYADDTCKEVTLKGHAHGTSTMWYTKVDGEWKMAGLIPVVRWYEFDYDKMFEAH